MAKKLKILDLEAKEQHKRDHRNSFAFMASSRLSKVGPIGLKKQASKEDPDPSKNRFSVVNQLIAADEEMNGEEFNDVYAAFNFDEAQEMSEPREKLYQKVLQTIRQSLDPDDPQSEL